MDALLCEALRGDPRSVPYALSLLRPRGDVTRRALALLGIDMHCALDGRDPLLKDVAARVRAIRELSDKRYAVFETQRLRDTYERYIMVIDDEAETANRDRDSYVSYSEVELVKDSASDADAEPDAASSPDSSSVRETGTNTDTDTDYDSEDDGFVAPSLAETDAEERQAQLMRVARARARLARWDAETPDTDEEMAP